MKKIASEGYSNTKSESIWRGIRVGLAFLGSNLILLLPILQAIPKEYDTPLIGFLTVTLTALDKYARDSGWLTTNDK